MMPAEAVNTTPSQPHRRYLTIDLLKGKLL
jgi:hypothetical protein